MSSAPDPKTIYTEASKVPALEFMIQAVSTDSSHLPAVQALWGKNRDSLGPFPKGAFEYYAKKNGLWAAIAGGMVIGYVSFRFSRGYLRIAHLCVDGERRGAGVADKLIDHVKAVALERRTDGIQLKCRRDFNHVKPLWIRNGFTSVRDVPGRGKDSALLTIWVFKINQGDLFSQVDGQDDRLLAVIDANIFFDLHGRLDGQSEEARYLREPWVEDVMELAVTNILNIEINECNDAAERERLRGCMTLFREVTAADPQFSLCQVKLKEILGWAKPSPNQDADIRQLATAVCSGAEIFITRDKALQKARNEIQSAFGVRVMEPSEVILELDEAENSKKYRPAACRHKRNDARTEGRGH